MFQPVDGEWKIEHIPSKASTLYTVGALLCEDGTDNTVSTTSSLRQVGICMQAKPTTDATTGTIMVAIPRSSESRMIGDVGSGSPNAADRNKTCDIASLGLTAAYGTDVHHQLVIAGYISATQGYFKINSKVSTLPAA
jgi:hypothetical protein